MTEIQEIDLFFSDDKKVAEEIHHIGNTYKLLYTAAFSVGDKPGLDKIKICQTSVDAFRELMNIAKRHGNDNSVKLISINNSNQLDLINLDKQHEIIRERIGYNVNVTDTLRP